MPRYYIETVVKYTGEVEAESREQAEEMGWNFSNTWDGDVNYDSVEHIMVDEIYDYEDADEEAEEVAV